jgi:2',3'-cyclic-nucleotide 2'-phosphodiesterase (5'-nucleotidase family)
MQQYEIEIVPNFIPYPLEKIKTVKNPLGILITNLLASYMNKKPYNFHFILINSGSFRSAWYPGIIRYAELRSMFPFDNKLSFFDIKGSDLKKLIQTVQNGQKAFYSSYGLSQVFQKSASNNSLSLINLVLADGSPIIDDQVYIGVTIDFLVSGGDDFNGHTGLFSNVVIKNELIRDILKN